MPDVRVLADGLGFTEGPVVRAADVVVVSIDQAVLWAIDEDGARVLASVGGGPNGLTEGSDGTIKNAQNGGQWMQERPRLAVGGVQAVRPDGTSEWITTDPITPNDLCFGPDGHLYVTDPTRRRGDDGRLWRVDVATGEADLLCSVHWYPNGIAFGPSDDVVFVADTFGRRIVAFPLAGGDPQTVLEMPRGLVDGFAIDGDGRFYGCALAELDDPSARGELQTFSAQGELLDVIPFDGRMYTNVAIAPDGLIVTASDAGAVLKLDRRVPPLPLHPFRASACATTRTAR
jgi:gluconolactonase